eukprot:7023409-Lingulodinium_polyedra.AAC.1
MSEVMIPLCHSWFWTCGSTFHVVEHSQALFRCLCGVVGTCSAALSALRISTCSVLRPWAS